MATDPLDTAAIESAVAQAYSKHRNNSRGRTAKYIPALAAVDPNLFAVCAMTPDGHTAAIGDVDHEFPIESISKVFTLALVIEERGPRAVRTELGANPTGSAFDSVLALELHHDKPTSPLVNAGAMATTSFVQASDSADRGRRILDFQSAFAGRPAVRQRGDQRFRAGDQLAQQGHRLAAVQRGIAFLRSDGGLRGLHPAVFDDAEHHRPDGHGRDAGRRWGQSPHRRAGHGGLQRPLRTGANGDGGDVHQSGDWAYTVGVPAKSGVGGGVLAVVPGRLAVAAFSPKLNSAGNSVRGWLAIADVVNRLKLGLFDTRKTK